VFRKALVHGNLALALDTARELPHVGLDDALRRVVLMAAKRDPLYESAAARFARRAISERRLSVEDSRRLLALVEALPHAPDGIAAARSAPRPEAQTEGLFVRLHSPVADQLSRAAFELRVHKRELVAALISAHVDGTTEAGRAELEVLLRDYRELST